MAGLAYILDTNAVADYINGHERVTDRINNGIQKGWKIYLAQPVVYEVLRGLFKTNASRKLHIFEQTFSPQFEQLVTTDDDWRQAAQLWADTTNKGKQLSDTDLLLAAFCIRLDAVLISSDADFDALSIKRENWREPS